MQGLAENTNKIFEAASKLNCLKSYTLIGGTALSLQIGKRLSEDLDFCKWSTNLTKQENLSPVNNIVPILNNINAADLDSLGAMKVEVMLRLSAWRDYYDIYSLLKEGKSLKVMIDGASSYSNRRLKTRDALNFLSNGNNYKKEKDFHLLKPVYDVDAKTIEELVKSEIKKEYIINIPVNENKRGKGLSM